MRRPDSIFSSIFRQLGFAVFSFATGLSISLTSIENFWLGWALMALAPIYLMGEIVHRARKHKGKGAVSASIIPITIIGLVGWLAFRPEPLEIQAMLEPGDYPSGATIGGVKWPSDVSEVDVQVRNPSSWAYANLDLWIETDLGVTQAGVRNLDDQCTAIPADLDELVVKGYDTAGKSYTSRSGYEPGMPYLAHVIKVHCDRVSSQSRTTIYLAIFATKPIVDGHFPINPFFKREASMVLVEGRFEAGGRRRSVRQTSCFIETCADLDDAHIPGA